MKRLIGLVLGLWTSLASANVPCTLPFNLQDGTTADATQVMANYNALVSCLGNAAIAGNNNDINELLSLITPFALANNGGTFVTATASGSQVFAVNGDGSVTSGLAGASSGKLLLNGTTSGSSQVAAGSTGQFTATNNTTGQEFLFVDATNGTTFGVTAGALQLDGTAPSSCTPTNAGTGAACSFQTGSTSSAGTIALAVGTSPPSNPGVNPLTMAIVFSQALPGAHSGATCTLTINANGLATGAGSWAAAFQLGLQVISKSSTGFTMGVIPTSNAQAIFAASTTYLIDYICVGR